MKKHLIILPFMFLPCFIFSLGYETQFETAKVYADKDEIPVEYYDPGSTKIQGYVIYAGIDKDPGDEIIIPYRAKHVPDKKDSDVTIYEQELVVDVVKNGKKIRDFIKMPLAYSREPLVYLTVRNIFDGETPKVVLMAFDGKHDDKKSDKLLTLVFNGFDTNDEKRSKQQFTTVKMPWDFIFYQFDQMSPDIIEYYSDLKDSEGTFHVRKADKEMPDQFIGQIKMDILKDMLARRNKDIKWKWVSKQEEKKTEKEKQ